MLAGDFYVTCHRFGHRGGSFRPQTGAAGDHGSGTGMPQRKSTSGTRTGEDSNAITLSNCQTNRPRGAFLAPKYGWMTGKGLLGRFAKYILSHFPPYPFLFTASFSSFVSFRRSFSSDGRNFTPAESCSFGR